MKSLAFNVSKLYVYKKTPRLLKINAVFFKLELALPINHQFLQRQCLNE